jgi:hypothetical protein
MQPSETFHATISPEGRALRARCDELILKNLIAHFTSDNLTPTQTANLTRAYCKLKQMDVAHDRNMTRLTVAGIRIPESPLVRESLLAPTSAGLLPPREAPPPPIQNRKSKMQACHCFKQCRSRATPHRDAPLRSKIQNQTSPLLHARHNRHQMPNGRVDREEPA